MKDILVLSNGSSEDDNRIRCSQMLAAQFEGYSTFVIVEEHTRPPVNQHQGEPKLPDGETKNKASDTNRAETRGDLERKLGDASPRHRIVRLEAAIDQIGPELGDMARRHDLFIGTLPSTLSPSTILLDDVLRTSGRGVLGLPPAITPAPGFQRIMVAWNGSREATRAIAEAMPLLVRATEVAVLLVDTNRHAGEPLEPGEQILQHLEHHGVAAAVAHVSSAGLPISEAILIEAHRMRADMIVMGAPSGTGFLHWFHDSVTRSMEIATDLPLLLAQ